MLLDPLSTVLLPALFGIAAAQNGKTDSTYDVLQYVDQLIGSSNGGAQLKTTTICPVS
jgi:hypothetical protein